MPSVSKKQHNFMAAIANSPSFAKKAGVPMSVGKDFVTADKGKKFSKGGEMKESKAMVSKEIGFMKKAGAPKSMIKHEMAEAKGMKKGGMAHEDVKMDKAMMQKAVNKHEGRLHKGEAMTKLAKGGEAKYMSFSSKGKPAGMKSVAKMADGGYTRAADGIASKGKTKGKMVKMTKGGYAC